MEIQGGMKMSKNIILALMLMCNVVYADPAPTTVAAPAAPVVPAMPTDTPNESSVNNDSTSNKVYIDQIGDNINLNVTQTGAGNKVGNGLSTNGLYLRGNNQTITTIQNGSNNNIEANLSTGTGNNAQATVTIQQMGDNNSVNSTCGVGTQNTCNNLTINWKLTGINNSISFGGSGDNINSAIDTTGDNNSFNILATDKSAQLLNVTGSTNSFNVDQFGGSTNGQSLKVTLFGDSNSFTSAQGGVVDSLINVNAVSNSGTFNININGAH